MDDKTITFNEVPGAISNLIQKIDNLEELIEMSLSPKKDEVIWMNVDELCDYLPSKPAKQTVYGWVCEKFIPYHKKGKRLQFIKSEIDEWLLKDDSENTEEQIKAAIEEHSLRIRSNIKRRNV